MNKSMRLSAVAFSLSASTLMSIGFAEKAMAVGKQCGPLFRAQANGAASGVISGTIGSDLFRFRLNLKSKEVVLATANGSEVFMGRASVESHADFQQKKHTLLTYSVIRPGTWMGDLNTYTFTIDAATGLVQRIGRQSVRVDDRNGSPVMPYRLTRAENEAFELEMGADKFKVSLDTKTRVVLMSTADGSKAFSGKAVVEVLSEKGETVYSVIRPETGLGRVNAYTFVVTTENGVQVLSRVGRESVGIGDRNGSFVMVPFSFRKTGHGDAVAGRMGTDGFKFSIDPRTGVVKLGEGTQTEFQSSLEIHKHRDFNGKETVRHTYTVLRPSTWLIDLNVYQFTFTQGRGGLKLESVGRESVNVQDRNGSAVMPFTIE